LEPGLFLSDLIAYQKLLSQGVSYLIVDNSALKAASPLLYALYLPFQANKLLILLE